MREPVDWPTRDLVSHRAAATPDRTALVDAEGGECWRYRALDAAVDDLAGALSAAGVEAGDRVAVLLDARPAVVRLVHAAMRLRATLVVLNVELATDTLAGQVRRADPDAVVCGTDTEATAVEVAGALDHSEVTGTAGKGSPDDSAPTVPVLSVDEPESSAVRGLASLDGEPVEPRAVQRDWTQLVMFTSGTTGEPKGVRLTAGNLLSSATASAFRLGLARDERWLVPLPTYHMGGLAPIVRSALYGTTVVLQRGFDAGRTAEVLDDYGVTGVSLVPTMLTRLLDAGWQPAERLRFVLVGGAPTPESLVERCEARGVPVCPTYGLTETASQVATATPAQAFEHPDTVGQPLVTTDVTVVATGEGDNAEEGTEAAAREAGEVCKPGESGEIVVDGPTVTPGYLDDERTRAAFGEHGLHTGDVGVRDEDGRLRVLGRLDDAVVTGGETVHPGEVADVVADHPAVEDVAVVGLADDEWGERVGALVVPDRAVADQLDLDLVEGHCREHLAGFKIPRTWGVAEDLPRTASGTVDREAIRERLR